MRILWRFLFGLAAIAAVVVAKMYDGGSMGLIPAIVILVICFFVVLTSLSVLNFLDWRDYGCEVDM